MTGWRDDARTARLLRLAAVAYAVTIAVHFGDHLRRGIDASPRPVVALGVFAAALQAAAIVAALRSLALAPLLAVAVALPDALGVVAVHLLPKWGAFSDPFPGREAVDVNAFSWASAGAEVAAGLAFAWIGWTAVRRRAVQSDDLKG